MRRKYDYAEIKKEINDLKITPYAYYKQKGYSYNVVKNGLGKIKKSRCQCQQQNVEKRQLKM